MVVVTVVVMVVVKDRLAAALEFNYLFNPEK